MQPLPQYESVEFKQKFIDRYSALTDWDIFSRVSLSWLRKSIRINTLKISVEECVTSLRNKGWVLDPIPWCEHGFWISGGRYDIGNLLEHMLGYIYVQEAASMIPPMVLDAKPGEVILDMCAAPGSKTTQIAAAMKNTGTLFANEQYGKRIAPLGLNLQRCGVSNTAILQMPGERITGWEFDKVLVDAPCSGTGTIRKSLKTIKMWNPKMVKSLSGLQYKLLAAAIENTKVGGIVVYSTCTLEPEENEGVVSRAVQHLPVELMPIEFAGQRSQAVVAFNGEEYDSTVKECLRIWPQDNDTEGFFIAKMRVKQCM